MIKIDKLELRGEMTPYVSDPTKRSHVFLAYASGVMLIPAALNGVLTTIQLAFSSMQLSLWENGFAIKFPTHEYNGVVTVDGAPNGVPVLDADGNTILEKRFAQKVRPLDEDFRVAIKCAFRKLPEVEDLIERGACLLRGEEDPGPIDA